MKPLTLGIIGAGRIGKLHAKNLMTRVKGTKLKAVSDPFLDEKWAVSNGIPVTGKDHRIMLDDSEIDAVLICSPSPQHAEQIIECAQVGKHIFCEKVAQGCEISRDICECRGLLKDDDLVEHEKCFIQRDFFFFC